MAALSSISFRALVRLVDRMAEIDTPDYDYQGSGAMGTGAAIEALVMAAPTLGVTLAPDTPRNLERFIEHRARRARERYRRKFDGPGGDVDILLPNGMAIVFKTQSKIMQEVYARSITGLGISDMPDAT